MKKSMLAVLLTAFAVGVAAQAASKKEPTDAQINEAFRRSMRTRTAC